MKTKPKSYQSSTNTSVIGNKKPKFTRCEAFAPIEGALDDQALCDKEIGHGGYHEFKIRWKDEN